MKQKIMWDVYCGTKSVGKVAERSGWKVFYIDYNPKFKPDLVVDMLYFNKRLVPKEYRNPLYIHFSPPCESFSLSGNSMFLGFPTGSKTYIGLALAYRCIEVIQQVKPRYYTIENPRAGLRSQWFMKPIERTTVTYCQYGGKNMKPTDIWNNFGFIGKICKNGMSCHESAPRGSRTGTQGEHSTEARGMIPEQLCEEIIKRINRIEGSI